MRTNKDIELKVKDYIERKLKNIMEDTEKEGLRLFDNHKSNIFYVLSIKELGKQLNQVIKERDN